MKRALLIAFLAAALSASAQTLPPAPDSLKIQPLGYWQQEKAHPSLGGLVVPVLVGTLLSSIFTMSDAENLNDLAPAVMVTGLTFGVIGYSFEIKAAKRKRFIPYH